MLFKAQNLANIDLQFKGFYLSIVQNTPNKSSGLKTIIIMIKSFKFLYLIFIEGPNFNQHIN